MSRIRRCRSLLVSLLGLLVFTSVWHVSHADFYTHTHTHSDGGTHMDANLATETDTQPQADENGGDNGLSVHPTHVLAYLTVAVAGRVGERPALVARPLSDRLRSHPPAGPFRPPRA